MQDTIYFDRRHHEFALRETADNQRTNDPIRFPLSVIVQVTRQCPLKCEFCSESEFFEDPSLTSLSALRKKLRGVRRVYLSGGEPLIRNDIFDLIQLYRSDFEILGLPTNCVYITPDVCERLRGRIDYINAGLDGPRMINDLVRGGYDQIIAGLQNLRNSGIDICLSTVILKATLPYLQFVVQIADDLGIPKVKMVVPVARGRAKALKQEEFAQEADILAKFEEIKALKAAVGWNPRVKFTFWNKTTEGYAMLVYPNQMVYAWPVLSAPDCALCIGDLSKESIQEIWARYPYKENHINKYVGTTMYKT